MHNKEKYDIKMNNQGRKRLNIYISNENYSILSDLSKNNNQFTDNNLTKSRLVDLGLTLLFKELENNKLNDLGLGLYLKGGDSDV